MLSVVCWRWGALFERVYVERLRAGLTRHLRIPYRLFCVTDDPTPIDGVTLVPMPMAYAHTPRCRRRMQQYSAAFASQFGPRMLSIDLDVVLVDDITSLVDRREPIVMWKVKHAGVFSGALVLCDTGALDGAWKCYERDPEGYPKRAAPSGIGSDQAMLNHWLKTQRPIKFWTERDGLVTYFGAGYEKFEHLGVGPNRPTLPAGARIVVLGAADKAVMDEGRFDWIRRHWTGAEVAA